uniref:Uncharacterized protein n=1 Tax=Zea mays TaxID=4577 RepID=C0PJM8_MAIZE|nr:unknown [Zea mays]
MTNSMSERGTFVEIAAKSIEKGIHGEEGALGARPSLGASCSTPQGANLSSLVRLSREPELMISDMLGTLSFKPEHSLVTRGAWTITAYSAYMCLCTLASHTM